MKKKKVFLFFGSAPRCTKRKSKTICWHKVSATGDVFYLQEPRNPHTNPSSRTSSQNWAFPVFSWVANKGRQHAAPQVNFPPSACSHSSTERNPEENKELKEVCLQVACFRSRSEMFVSERLFISHFATRILLRWANPKEISGVHHRETLKTTESCLFTRMSVASCRRAMPRHVRSSIKGVKAVRARHLSMSELLMRGPVFIRTLSTMLRPPPPQDRPFRRHQSSPKCH